MRAIWSEAPPAPAAATISTGLLGSHAAACPEANAKALVNAAHVMLREKFMDSSCLNAAFKRLAEPAFLRSSKGRTLRRRRLPSLPEHRRARGPFQPPPARP